MLPALVPGTVEVMALNMCYPVSSLCLMGHRVPSQPSRCLHLPSHSLVGGWHPICAVRVRERKNLKPLGFKSPLPPSYTYSVPCQCISRFQAVQSENRPSETKIHIKQGISNPVSRLSRSPLPAVARSCLDLSWLMMRLRIILGAQQGTAGCHSAGVSLCSSCSCALLSLS